MKLSTFIISAAGAVVFSAHAEPLTDRDRAAAAQAQADQQKRMERATENCRLNRGTDCDTAQGLQEWLLLDRSRADAVLDRVLPSSGNSAGGSSQPPQNSPAAGSMQPPAVSPATQQTSPGNR